MLVLLEEIEQSKENTLYFEIEEYISTNEPYDKAGAYAAQGLAAVFVEKIDGCFNNVVGISVFEVARMLKQIKTF